MSLSRTLSLSRARLCRKGALVTAAPPKLSPGGAAQCRAARPGTRLGRVGEAGPGPGPLSGCLTLGRPLSLEIAKA